jgi:hypothetical protein
MYMHVDFRTITRNQKPKKQKQTNKTAASRGRYCHAQGHGACCYQVLWIMAGGQGGSMANENADDSEERKKRHRSWRCHGPVLRLVCYSGTPLCTGVFFWWGLAFPSSASSSAYRTSMMLQKTLPEPKQTRVRAFQLLQDTYTYVCTPRKLCVFCGVSRFVFTVRGHSLQGMVTRM